MKAWTRGLLPAFAALALTGSAIAAQQAVAPAAARADWTYGVPGYGLGGPGPYPPAATTKTVYDPPSSTYLHEGNAAAWLAFTWSCGPVPYCTAFSWAYYHLSPTFNPPIWSVPSIYDQRVTNNSIESLIELYNPATRQYCWEKLRVTGTDASMSWGIDTLQAACGGY